MTDKTTAAGTPQVPFKQRAWEFWRRNQILLLQMPIMLAFLFGSYVLLKSIDPRIGVEGFGNLFSYALNGVRIILILFTAWWIKKWCWFDLFDKTELALFNTMREPDKDAAWMAFWIVARDRIEWFVALAFATYWYTR